MAHLRLAVFLDGFECTGHLIDALREKTQLGATGWLHSTVEVSASQLSNAPNQLAQGIADPAQQHDRRRAEHQSRQNAQARRPAERLSPDDLLDRCQRLRNDDPCPIAGWNLNRQILLAVMLEVRDRPIPRKHPGFQLGGGSLMCPGEQAATRVEHRDVVAGRRCNAHLPAERVHELLKIVGVLDARPRHTQNLRLFQQPLDLDVEMCSPFSPVVERPESTEDSNRSDVDHQGQAKGE